MYETGDQREKRGGQSRGEGGRLQARRGQSPGTQVPQELGGAALLTESGSELQSIR